MSQYRDALAGGSASDTYALPTRYRVVVLNSFPLTLPQRNWKGHER